MFSMIVAGVIALVYFWIVMGGGSGPQNAVQWKWALAWSALSLWGSKKLMEQNRKGFAWLLLVSVALPGVLLVVFLIVLANSNLHWQ